MVEGSPWTSIRVRKAANLAIDRAGINKLLGGLMIESKGHVYPGHPWFGSPSFDIKYDPAAAKKLLAEAGYNAQRPLQIKIAISPSGSGQMLPLPMNEFMQQSLKENCGVDVTFEVVEWNTLLGSPARRTRPAAMARCGCGECVAGVVRPVADGTLVPVVQLLPPVGAIPAIGSTRNSMRRSPRWRRRPTRRASCN